MGRRKNVRFIIYGKKRWACKFNVSVRGKPLTRLSGRRCHFSRRYFTWDRRREIRSDKHRGAGASHIVNSVGEKIHETRLIAVYVHVDRSSRGNPFKGMRCSCGI